MELGINTDFTNEPWELEEIKNKLREIAEAGFTHIHWCFDWDGDYLYARSEMEQIRSWMDELGLKEKGLHASKGSRRFVERYAEAPHGRKDYLSELEPNRIAGVELIKNRVELVHVLGGKEIVLHMYLPTKSFEEKPETKELFYQQACKSLDELQPYCKELGVKICLENLFEASAKTRSSSLIICLTLSRRFSGTVHRYRTCKPCRRQRVHQAAGNPLCRPFLLPAPT